MQESVAWSAAHTTGDEKGEAQTFIDRLFMAFGQRGARDVGGTFEERIRQLFDEHARTGFADYVWKPIVLIEMKKQWIEQRGPTSPATASRRSRTGRTSPPAARASVVLCNFDQF